MKPILLWDVMGTLVHDPFFIEMPGFFGVTFDSMLADKHPSAWVEFEVGRRTEREFLEDFFLDGRAFDHRAFVDTIASAYEWLPGMEALLAELHDAGCAMHAFSNYPVWYRLIEERLGVSRYLEWSFVSCHTGCRKPDPAAYQCVIDRFQEEGRDLLFVDDRESNCAAARAAGIGAVRFEGIQGLRLALEGEGVL
ncbi:MAG: HAD-IA family hydrolase [Myxococcota bacterium]